MMKEIRARKVRLHKNSSDIASSGQTWRSQERHAGKSEIERNLKKMSIREGWYGAVEMYLASI
jgi:hypothetical protein